MDEPVQGTTTGFADQRFGLPAAEGDMDVEANETGSAVSLDALRRRWPLIVLSCVVVVIAALGLSSLQTKRYQATAVVYLNTSNLANEVAGVAQPADDSLTLARAAQTQANIAASPQVAALALRLSRVSGMTDADLLAATSITPESNADLLDFAVTDTVPSQAIKLATAYARAYTKTRLDLDTAPLTLAIQKLEKVIAGLGAGAHNTTSLYSGLLEKEQQLETLSDLETSNSSVVQIPTKAPKVSPKVTRNAILGLLVGGLLGLLVAWLAESLDVRIRSEDELGQILATPLVARLSPPERYSRATSTLTSIADPAGRGAEEFRILRSSVELAAMSAGRVRTLLVTSAAEAEGKSMTVANLGVTFARLGKRILIVDLDLRRPSQAGLFGVRPQHGITDVVRGDVRWEMALAPVSINDERGAPTDDARPPVSLDILAPTITPLSVGEFLALGHVGSLLRQLAESPTYDYVLIDSPPIVQFSDAQTVANSVDAVLALSRLGVVTRPGARELHRLLSLARAPTIGYVVTGANPQPGGYGYGYSNRSERSPRRWRRQRPGTRRQSIS